MLIGRYRELAALLERVLYQSSRATSTRAEVSTQLFYTLVMLLRGRALDTVQNTDLGNGLEVYRELVSQYRPRLSSRLRAPRLS